MILTCPACGTSYVVKDGAIPPQGRQVRCASCKHSWHQDAEAGAAGDGPPPPPEPIQAPVVETAAASEAPVAVTEEPPLATESVGPDDDEPAADPMPAPGFAEPVVDSDPPASFEPVCPEPAVEQPVGSRVPRPAAAEPVDEFADWNEAHFGSDEPASKLGRRLGIVAAIVVLVAALAAAAWFVAPREWMARAGLSEVSGDSPLKLMVTSQDRQKLASGNDLVSLSGRVINPTEQTLPIPPLQADLRDSAGKLVYSWRIAPPAPQLAPRASASFNAAELGVPPNATSLTLRWAS